MKKRSIFFLILILSFNIPLIYSATDEGYGEGNDNLGQFVDSFENLDNVTVIDDLIRNATLNCIELNTTLLNPIYEDFDAYAETDALGRLNHANFQSNWTGLLRTDHNIHLHYDYGDDYFTDFIHEFEFYIDTISPNAIDMILHGIVIYTDALNDWLGNRGANIDQLGVITMVTGDEAGYRLQVRFSNGGADTRTNGDFEFAEDTQYYAIFNKTGTSASLLVYSDSARTIEVEEITHICGVDDSYRYINAPMSTDIAGAQTSTGFIDNLWLGNTTGGYEDDGYFITEDYLNYTTGNSLVSLLNASIPANTQIQIQFSYDNITWGDNEGTPLDSNILVDGFNAIDLRLLNYTDIYQMVNMSTTNVLVTPRLYQLRLVTTNGSAGGVGGIVYITTGINSSGVMIVIFLFSLGLGIIWMVKKK